MKQEEMIGSRERGRGRIVTPRPGEVTDDSNAAQAEPRRRAMVRSRESDVTSDGLVLR